MTQKFINKNISDFNYNEKLLYLGDSLKNLTFSEGPWKTNIEGQFPEKGEGLGQFANLRGLGKKVGVVSLKGGWYPMPTMAVRIIKEAWSAIWIYTDPHYFGSECPLQLINLKKYCFYNIHLNDKNHCSILMMFLNTLIYHFQ